MKKDMTPKEQEPREMIKYIEIDCDSHADPECVDGREAENPTNGPQMLGGSLHPVALSLLFKNENINSGTVTKELVKLRDEGYKTGVHIGGHQDLPNKKSDCGFADNLSFIFKTVSDHKSLISGRLEATYNEYSSVLGKQISLDEFKSTLSEVFDQFENFNNRQDCISLFGQDLIDLAQNNGAHCQKLKGNHGEKVAFVNLVKGKTFDTQEANEHGWQAFNLDVWSAVEQAKVLGVNETKAMVASLVLYAATEKVLVEDKQKPALNIVINHK